MQRIVLDFRLIWNPSYFFCNYHQSRGITLIEVLVTLVILSLGILSLTRMDYVALQTNNAAYLHSVAETQLLSMSERLRANPFNWGLELVRWNQLNNLLLPRGHGDIKTQNQIVISWFDKSMRSMASHF